MDASRLETAKNQTKESPYNKSAKVQWDNTQKLAMPPPELNGAINTPENEEYNNFSNKNRNNKEIDKHIDLPNTFDSEKTEIENEVDYDECRFNDGPKQDE